MKPHRYLGIDPSLNECGLALLEDDPRQPHTGKLVDLWRVTVEGEELHERAKSVYDQLGVLLETIAADVVVVETPADPKRGGRGGFRGRSVMTAPIYGIGVCAALLAAEHWRDECGVPKPTCLYPSVNDWTGRDVPSSKGDKDKAKRVAYACHLWRVDPKRMGPKSVAGNVADAMFLARWGMWRTQA